MVHKSVEPIQQAAQLDACYSFQESLLEDFHLSTFFSLEVVPDVQQPLSQIPADTASPLLILPPPVPSPSPALRPVETPVVGAPGMGSVPTEPDDEEGLKHLEQVQVT